MKLYKILYCRINWLGCYLTDLREFLLPGAKNAKYMMRPMSGIHANGVGQKSYAQVRTPEE